ncbi:MAG: HEAT repeat domain-containing protein, partial [Planctomycetes bacterium]|nr:HEAT repeat domain-containing protein [Planctomycetota bacterium]
MSDRWLRLTLTLTLVVLAGLALFSLFVLLRQPSAADARPLALAPLPAPDAGEREVEFNVFHAARARDPADEAAGPEAAVSADTTGGGPASEAVPTPEEARDLLVTAGRRYISRDHRWLAPIRALVPDHAGLALAVSRELLTDPRPLVAGKVGAIKALGRLGGPEALTLLLLAAESDPNTFVRRTAIEELEALGENPGVSARLIAAAERERDESLRARLLAAAGQVGVAADLSGLYA